MKTPKRVARVGSFENLEERVVMTSRATIVNTDIQQFFSNYAATIPGLVSNFEQLEKIAIMTGTTADKEAAAAANTKVHDTLVTDVNNLGTQLLKDLGNTTANANSIRLSVTGASSPGGVVFTPSGNANDGSLMNALLRIQGVDTPALAGTSGLNTAADLSIATSYAVALGHSVFPTAPFGTFSATWFANINPLAQQLKADKAAASTPPTADQTAQINKDIAAIRAETIKDVNTLGTSLVTTLGKGATAGIGQVITGVTSSNSVTFNPTNTAAFGSLMATALEFSSNPTLLLDPNINIAIVTLYAFI
jgi:hypothetical protein